jgi:hypothetical protein
LNDDDQFIDENEQKLTEKHRKKSNLSIVTTARIGNMVFKSKHCFQVFVWIYHCLSVLEFSGGRFNFVQPSCLTLYKSTRHKLKLIFCTYNNYPWGLFFISLILL